MEQRHLLRCAEAASSSLISSLVASKSGHSKNPEEGRGWITGVYHSVQHLVGEQ